MLFGLVTPPGFGPVVGKIDDQIGLGLIFDEINLLFGLGPVLDKVPETLVALGFSPVFALIDHQIGLGLVFCDIDLDISLGPILATVHSLSPEAKRSGESDDDGGNNLSEHGNKVISQTNIHNSNAFEQKIFYIC